MPSERFTGLAAVLDAIRSEEGITQPVLTERVGLGRSVVAQRVGELESLGLVEPAGLGPSTGGRAPRRLRLRAESGYVLGVDIATNELLVAVSDLAGNLLATLHESSDVSDGPEVIFTAVERMADELLDETGRPGQPVVGRARHAGAGGLRRRRRDRDADDARLGPLPDPCPAGGPLVGAGVDGQPGEPVGAGRASGQPRRRGVAAHDLPGRWRVHRRGRRRGRPPLPGSPRAGGRDRPRAGARGGGHRLPVRQRRLPRRGGGPGGPGPRRPAARRDRPEPGPGRDPGGERHHPAGRRHGGGRQGGPGREGAAAPQRARARQQPRHARQRVQPRPRHPRRRHGPGPRPPHRRHPRGDLQPRAARRPPRTSASSRRRWTWRSPA